MSNVERQHLLTASQMARFVTDGYLQLDELVPREHNEAVLADEKRLPHAGYTFWQESDALRAVFELPQVKGAVQSFVGVNPIYDHSYLHVVPAHQTRAQEWHADSVLDTRPFAFDVQAFYFTHDAPAEMGPTLILPGSHLRKVNTASIGRYKNIVGQRQLVARAGTIVFMHHGIWHCAQPNHTDQIRYVFKLRLRPGQQQRNLFNTEGYQDPEVAGIIQRGYYAWQGNEDRLDHIQRAKFWRYVTGDDHVDVSFEQALTRMAIN
ncbi:MAG TPA: phytanoyl-CoA dioxygenase family protein [Ktedonobacteraceae bacterium]|nr:phytanoyl-CoA dioxygenase family protein [Ktedonobacteraceae bacterium]